MRQQAPAIALFSLKAYFDPHVDIAQITCVFPEKL